MSLSSLLGQLVQEVTNDGDRQSVMQCRKKIERDLQTYQFPGTDNIYIAERYAGLVEKLHIKNQSEKAMYLQSCVDRLVNDKSEEGTKKKHLMFDVLSFLINAANDPVNSEFQPSSDNGPNGSSELTWESIIAEEPLTGGHWQQWDILSTDDDDDDDLDDQAEVENLDISDAKKKRRERSVSNAAMAEPGRANKYYLSHIQYDKPAELDTASILESEQYWMPIKLAETKNRAKAVDGIGMQAFSDPCTLAPSLNELRLRSDDVRSITSAPEGYIDELDAIREVLFMIQGYPGILFHRVDHEDIFPGRNDAIAETRSKLIFKVKTEAVVQHMSILTFNNILAGFCDYGNSLNELRHFKNTVCLSQPTRFGQTCQAFASHLDRLITQFEAKISDLQTTYYVQKMGEEGPSLLKLQETVQDDLELFRSLNAIQLEIHVLQDRLYKDLNQQNEEQENVTLAITVSLLDILFQHLDIAQSSNHPTFDKLKETFLATVVPYGILMDDWIFEGSLAGDVAAEFFIQRNAQINSDSSRFWRHGFQIRIADSGLSYPTFLHSLVPRIFFAGKAVNFMLRMDISEVSLAIYSNLERFSTQLGQQEKKCVDRKEEKAKRAKISPSERLLEAHLPSTTRHTPKQKSDEVSNVTLKASSDIQMQDLFRHSFLSLLERYVEPRYKHLASLLMVTLNKQAHLQRHLRCLASLFLMIEGDLMHKFTDLVFVKMDEGKPWYDNRTINALFLEACRDEQLIDAENVHIEVNLSRAGVRVPKTTSHTPLILSPSLSIMESIIIHYQLPNPINNFIRRSTLQEYRKISTFVMQIKRSKRLMEQLSVFKGRFQNAREGISDSMAKFYSLRLRLIWFVNAVHSYILTTILHSETIQFQRELTKLVNVDDIVLFHDDYVRKIVDRCLLNEKTQSIRAAIIHVLDMTNLLSRLFKKHVQDPASRNFTNASVFMMMPPRFDSDDEEEVSDSVGSDENAAAEDEYLSSFEKGLSMIDEEYTRATGFITTSLDIMAKSSGFSWFEALAQSLSV